METEAQSLSAKKHFHSGMEEMDGTDMEFTTSWEQRF
jgi:hypothetical protein